MRLKKWALNSLYSEVKKSIKREAEPICLEFRSPEKLIFKTTITHYCQMKASIRPDSIPCSFYSY